jgi:Zn-finger nucleic acid-binding protein
MASNLCPRCDSELERRISGTGAVSICPEGHGVFLDRIELGNLVESETDWHRNASHNTQPLPRITADMTAPPASRTPARAWVETLFRM